jgi:xanthine dehydrogenase accessory factor
VFTFSLDDNYGWDDGLICGGRMTILAHSFPADGAQGYFRALLTRINAGSGCTEAVVIGAADDARAGDRYLFDPDGSEVARIARVEAPDVVRKGLQPLRDRPGPGLRNGVAYLPILPRVTLLLVGGGHVAQALAELASRVGFAVRVLDDRDRYASRERFPSAEELLVGDIGSTLKHIVPTLTPDTYALVMTRGHSHDEEALYHLAGTACGYVGMIGSKRKIRLIYEDLIAKGIAPADLERVHAPLGLPIGSQTVPEIAVSIVAELIACRNLGTTRVSSRAGIRPETAQT